MTSIKVEKVAIPKGAGRRGRNYKYPWPSLKVGLSIVVESDDADNAVRAGNSYFKRQGVSVSFATQEEGDKIRIFRIK